MPEEIVKAFEAHNWYALAALLLFALIAFLKNAPLGQALWDWLDEKRVRWLAPVVIAFATGFTTAFYSGQAWLVALVTGVSAVLWIALPAMGLHGALRDSPIPYVGRARPKEVVVTDGKEIRRGGS